MTMRSLVLTFLPVPEPRRDVHGIYKRLGLFVRALARLSEVEVLMFAPLDRPGAPSEHEASLRSSATWGVPVTAKLASIGLEKRRLSQAVSLPFSLASRRDFRPFLGDAQTRAAREALDRRPSIVLAHQLPMQLLLAKAGGTSAPIVYDINDIEHESKLRAARNAGSWLHRSKALAEVPAIYLAERRAMREVSLAFLCSEADRDKLSARRIDVGRIRVAPNAIAMPLRRPPIVREPVVLYLGVYGYDPNRLAAERLIHRVWPRVRARVGAARLVIAGRHCERIAGFADPPPGVEFAGFVEDLRGLYDRVRMVCCPLELGGGTRIKLIEAAAYGKPIVSTSIGAEGLSFRDGRDILLRASDADLAQASVSLLEDDALAERLAESAFASVRGRFLTEEIERTIAAQLRGLVGEEPDRDRPGEAGAAR